MTWTHEPSDWPALPAKMPSFTVLRCSSTRWAWAVWGEPDDGQWPNEETLAEGVAKTEDEAETQAIGAAGLQLEDAQAHRDNVWRLNFRRSAMELRDALGRSTECVYHRVPPCAHVVVKRTAKLLRIVGKCGWVRYQTIAAAHDRTDLHRRLFRQIRMGDPEWYSLPEPPPENEVFELADRLVPHSSHPAGSASLTQHLRAGGRVEDWFARGGADNLAALEAVHRLGGDITAMLRPDAPLSIQRQDAERKQAELRARGAAYYASLPESERVALDALALDPRFQRRGLDRDELAGLRAEAREISAAYYRAHDR